MQDRKRVVFSLLSVGLVLSLTAMGLLSAPPAAAQPAAQAGAAAPAIIEQAATPAALDPAHLSTPLLIEQAYARGEITSAARVLYLAYALYEPQSLPPQFHGHAPWHGTHYAREVQEALPALRAAAGEAMQQEMARLILLAATVCDNPDSPNSDNSANFHFNYDTISGGLTLADYETSLETTFAVEVTSYGWAGPPLCTGGLTCGGVSNPFGRYPVQIQPLGEGLYGYVTNGGGSYTGFVGDNPNTPVLETAAEASCMVLGDDYSVFPEGAQAALDATTAHEFVHAIQYGYGDPQPVEDDMWYESSAAAMEDEVFDDSNSNYIYLWPVVSNSLGGWPDDGAPFGLSVYSNFLFFRHVAEHNGGTNQEGGGEEILQHFWENVAAGQPELIAYNNALAVAGTNLPDAFHRYAIAARFSKPCSGGYVAPYCFEEGAAYVAAAGAPAPVQGSIADNPGAYTGSIRSHYAANWIDLPAGGSPYQVELANTAADGALRGSIVCDTDTALTIVPFASVVGGGQSATIASFDPSLCTQVTAVITNQAQSSGNPNNPPAQSYTLAVKAEGSAATPTATPTATATSTATPSPTSTTLPASTATPTSTPISTSTPTSTSVPQTSKSLYLPAVRR